MSKWNEPYHMHDVKLYLGIPNLLVVTSDGHVVKSVGGVLNNFRLNVSIAGHYY